MVPSGGSTSLELRWIEFGAIPEAIFEWLGPFHDWIEQREDRYLINPSVRDLGVKIKGGIELDLKAYRGTLDHPSVPGGGRGRLERWEKWRFPLDAVSLPSTDDGESWTAIRKIRRRRSFRLVDGGVVERPVSEAQLPGCSVELTEIFFGTERWWTLCFEAGGDARDLERELRATADLLLRAPRPAGVRLDLEDSRSYPAWLNARVHSRIDPAERFAASLA